MALACSLWCHTVVKWSEVKSLSSVRLFATPWTVAYQDLPSMGFSRQEYWLEWAAISFSRGSSQPRDRTDALPSEPPGNHPPKKKISTCVQKKISTRASVVPLKTSQSLRRLKFFHHMHHTVVAIRKCKWPLTTLILLKQREECKERSNSISIVFDSENESGHKNVVFSQTHQKLVVASMFQKQLADLHC